MAASIVHAGSSAVATTAAPAQVRRGATRLGPRWLRTLLIVAAALGAVAGLLVTGEAATLRAVQAAGPELTRLLRLMALVKILLGAGALFAIAVRFRFPIARPLALGYVTAGGVMAAGPGLIWGMAHVGLGALLLHGGLAALLALAWADGGTVWAGALRRR
jgi:hypothetical protein